MSKVYTLDELRQSLYTEKPHYLVVGHPISHSLSPVMHQAALKHYGMEADYVALDLSPQFIGSFAAWCNKPSFLGCNITIPFKEMLLPIVDQMDTDSESVGVINTIAKTDGYLKGFNTDVYGFIKPLENRLEYIEEQRVIVFGTGGASKAVQTALIQSGVEEIIFVSRNPIQKQVKSSAVHTETVDYNQWQSYAEESTAFINTTPVGMLPDGDNVLINQADGKLLSEKLCYDLIYNPAKTPFLLLAERNNAISLNGLEMLIQQGSRSFEIWTGKPFPLEKIRTVLKDSFKPS